MNRVDYFFQREFSRQCAVFRICLYIALSCVPFTICTRKNYIAIPIDVPINGLVRLQFSVQARVRDASTTSLAHTLFPYSDYIGLKLTRSYALPFQFLCCSDNRDAPNM